MGSTILNANITTFTNRPPRNAIVDYIDKSLVPFVLYRHRTHYQYKTPQLHLDNFRLELEDGYAIEANSYMGFTFKKPTYMKLAVSTDKGETSYYYFIDTFERVSNSVARLSATLDVLNTYFQPKDVYGSAPDIWAAISRRSRISRRMVDRFNHDTSKSSLIAKIDAIPENINPALYMKGEPVEFKDGELPSTAYVGSLPDEWVLLACTLNGDDKSPTILLLPRYNQIQVDGETGKDTSYIKADIETDSGLSYSAQKLASFNNIDLTSSRIIAVYSIPVLPETWPTIAGNLRNYSQLNRWKATSIPPDSHLILEIEGSGLTGFGFAIATNFDGMDIFNLGEDDQKFGMVVHNQLLKGISKHLLYKDSLANPLSNIYWPDSTKVRSNNEDRKVLDPKLYNSEFTQYRFIYDSTSLTISLEQFACSEYIPNFSVDVTFSTGFSGQYYFTVDITGAERVYRTSPFDNVLQVGRSNKEAFYSSQYWDYMRNGYNYDVKAKSMQDASSWISVVGQLLTSLASTAVGIATANPFAIAGGVSTAVSAVTSISSAAIGTIQRQDNINRKIDTYKAAGIEVKDLTANDLFRTYQGSLLPIMCHYECRDDIKTLVDDLFYYYGYSRAETLGALDSSFEDFRANEMESRIWFDYVEMGLEWKNSAYYLDQTIIDEISAKFAQGVTIFHIGADGTFDFEQTKENWEVWAV